MVLQSVQEKSGPLKFLIEQQFALKCKLTLLPLEKYHTIESACALTGASRFHLIRIARRSKKINILFMRHEGLIHPEDFVKLASKYFQSKLKKLLAERPL